AERRLPPRSARLSAQRRSTYASALAAFLLSASPSAKPWTSVAPGPNIDGLWKSGWPASSDSAASALPRAAVDVRVAARAGARNELGGEAAGRIRAGGVLTGA